MEFKFLTDTGSSNSGLAAGKKMFNIEIVELGSDIFKGKEYNKGKKEPKKREFFFLSVDSDWPFFTVQETSP